MITGESFATQDQVLGYCSSNLDEIMRKPNMEIQGIEESNYYIFDEDMLGPGSSELKVMLVNTTTEFYITITPILKQTGPNTFLKLQSGKNNINFGRIQSKISNGILRIKHIESDARIKMAMRPIPLNPPNPVTQPNYTLVAMSNSTPVALSHPYDGPPVDGHMMDWIRYQQAQAARPTRVQAQPFVPNRFDQQSVPSRSILIHPSAVEEIKDDASYKDNVTCKICLSNKINIVCIPCGHCFCSACNTQTTNNLCAMCRAPITKTQALFI